MTFYALMCEFERVHKSNVCILCFGSADPLLELFPLLKDKTVIAENGVIANPISYTHWLYGSESPRKGLVYFTWHRQYLGGAYATAWEESNCEELNHKNFVRMILALPASSRPQDIILQRASAEINDGFIILAPIANSVRTNVTIFIDVAKRLAKLNIRVLWNLGNVSARPNSEREFQSALLATQVKEVFPLANIFQGDLQELLALCVDEKSYTITSRSGLCELLSLTSANYSIISDLSDEVFWSLNNWGNKPRISIKENPDALEGVISDIRGCMVL